MQKGRIINIVERQYLKYQNDSYEDKRVHVIPRYSVNIIADN